MTILAIAAAFFALGAMVRQWWTLVVPAACGCLAAVSLVLTGAGLGDTPLPFLAIVGTAAVAVGVATRRPRAERHAAL